MTENRKRRLFHPAIVCVASLALIALIWWNWRADVSLKFTAPWMNSLFFSVALLILPVLAFVSAARSTTRRVLRVAAGLVVGVLVSPTFLLALFSLFELPDALRGDTGSMDPISEADAGRYRVVAYLTNGGATTAFGIVARQEREFVPGVMLARKLGSWYPADSARVEVDGPGRVRIHVRTYDSGNGYGGAVMAGFLAAPVLLIGLAGCIAELPPALRGEENLSDRVAEARAGRYRIATYHTLGPPYSASGILVRQERVLVPGVMLARRLYSTSRVNATYTHIHVDSPDRVRITSAGFKPPLTHSYRLRSLPFGL